MVVCASELESTAESGTDVARGRGGYRVFVRVRPLLGPEVGKELAVEVVSRVKLRVARCDQTPLLLRFDRTFEPECGQADVFDSIRELITAAADGRSGTILAYGQTGSGKTHPMMGEMFVEPRHKPSPSVQKGIIARGLEDLFQKTRMQAQAPRNRRATFWRLYVSFMEIYNERVYDLLSENHCAQAGRGNGSRGDMGFAKRTAEAVENRLDVRENPDGSVCVPGVTVVEVHGSEEATEVLKIGLLNRKCGDNGVNQTSSRSHAVFQVILEKRSTNGSEESLLQASKLNFVDLAGSEKLQADASVTGALKQELTSINHSLSSLGNCISALVDQKRTHVPYRNSRLTRLLQDSLRGQSLTAMFICISPAFSALEETLSSLKFADRAKRVILDRQQPIHAARSADKQVAELTSQVQELQGILKSEREQRIKLQSILQERYGQCAEDPTNFPDAGDHRSQGIEEERVVHQIAARQETVLNDHKEASAVGEVCGIAELLALASDVQLEVAEKEAADQECFNERDANRNAESAAQAVDGQSEEDSVTRAESPASSANAAPCDPKSGVRLLFQERQEITCTATETSGKDAGSKSGGVDAYINDIYAQLSVLSNQNTEVLARLETLEARAGHSESDDVHHFGGRWRRAAMRRLREASSDLSLSASDLRHLIGEAFAPAAIPPDRCSESSVELESSTLKIASDHAPPIARGEEQPHEDRGGGRHHERGRSPTIHEASPWAPLSIALGKKMHHEQGAPVATEATSSPRTSGSCSSPGVLVDSPIDLDLDLGLGCEANGECPEDRKSSPSRKTSLAELRRRNSPGAASPNRGEMVPSWTSSPPWGKVGVARESSEETERGPQIVHSLVSQTSQVMQMRSKALEKRAEEASQQREQLGTGPLFSWRPITPRQGDLASGEVIQKPSPRTKVVGKTSATPPSRSRPERAASPAASGGSSPVLPARDREGRRQLRPHDVHHRAGSANTTKDEHLSSRTSPDQARNRALHLTTDAGDTHSASALGRGAPLPGVAASVKEQLRRKKELLRRGRDDRARLRNERQRSPGSPTPSGSPNHELWSCLGRPLNGQASTMGSAPGSAGNVANGSPHGVAGSSNARVSEVVSRCWEEFEGALQRASISSP